MFFFKDTFYLVVRQLSDLHVPFQVVVLSWRTNLVIIRRISKMPISPPCRYSGLRWKICCSRRLVLLGVWNLISFSLEVSRILNVWPCPVAKFFKSWRINLFGLQYIALLKYDDFFFLTWDICYFCKSRLCQF